MNKAFTLVELLGVIIIFGIIGLIATPVVQNMIDSNATKACNSQIESFKKSANNYVASNPFANLNEERETITIGKLQDEGYIEDSELRNPKGGYFSKDSKIIIEYNDKKITYTYEKDNIEKACED